MTEIVRRQQLWKDMFGSTEKSAELANTYDMPQSVSPKKVNEKPGGEKAVIPKTASIRGEQAHNVMVDDDAIFKMAFELDTNEEGTSGEQPAALPQAKVLTPHVNVSGKEAPKASKEKKASCYACPSIERYPLDGYDQVVKAASYFDEHGGVMEPSMRREFCHNLVKRASALGVKVSPEVERYGANTYASPEQIKIALDARRTLLEEPDIAVLDKLAEAQPTMLPDTFAAVLEEFDRRNLLDHHYGDIPDPYFSTFDKVAEEVVTEDDAAGDDSLIVGNEYITKEQLLEFSKRGYDSVWKRFGKDVADEFAKDPTAIFSSLPRDQKLVLMRMANNSKSQIYGATTS
jgi:hypothetical protein